MAGEKLHKVLAQSGLGSRREIEKWIIQGRIAVDGRIARVGTRVTSENQISIDGKPILAVKSNQRQRVIIYHKPEGEICSRVDTKNRSTVYDNLPKLSNGRWVSVGRLDINTSGLLIFTTSGELAHRLMHPRYGIEREYIVRVSGAMTEAQRQRVLKGVKLDGQAAQFTTIREQRAAGGLNHWYNVTIAQGRYREVRRIFNSVGISVNRLKRIRFGTLRLPMGLRPGQWRELDGPPLQRMLDSIVSSEQNTILR